MISRKPISRIISSTTAVPADRQPESLLWIRYGEFTTVNVNHPFILHLPPMPFVRVREHVNPLSRKYQTPIAPPQWENIYAAPTAPLHLDLGCGRGRFLLQMAQLQPNQNFLGLEIREPLVEQAIAWKTEQGLPNLHYLFCNVNNSLRPILASFPIGVLHRVTIQFPDPWFKRRHQKRRVVQPELVDELAEFLSVGGTVFVQSDVPEVAAEMRDRFDAHTSFSRLHSGWLSNNPFPVPTERELSTLEQGEPVYRALFQRIQPD